jgi:predicted enzyme related to lactoylglutathione lyase
MTEGIKTIIFPVRDLAKAKNLFSVLLGAQPSADAPYYVQFDVGGQAIGLDPNGHGKGMTGPVGYVDVENIEATVQTLLDAGAQTVQDVQDMGWGKLAVLADADGNVFGLRQRAA